MIAAFSTPRTANAGHEIVYFDERLSEHTAVLQRDAPAACLFVNDQCDEGALAALARQGCRLIALRCAGFNNVDLRAAERLGLKVVRVPAYSPYAVAEHALALILCLNRKIHRAYNRVREGNFALDGLLGFDMHGKTVGIIGTGKIGLILARTLRGHGLPRLGARSISHRPSSNRLGGAIRRTARDSGKSSDIISLHCPLTPETHHLIDSAVDRPHEAWRDARQHQPRRTDRHRGGHPRR